MGKRKLELDERQIEALAALHCQIIEIAAVMGCSVDTLERRYMPVIQRGREHGKMTLRRKQVEVALSGNVTMLIWLGKQMLGQTDRTESMVTTVEKPVKPVSTDQVLELIKAAKGAAK